MTQALWNFADIATAVKAAPLSIIGSVSGVSIDSRTVQPGDLFIALKGPNFDGARFVADAFAKGAVLAITESRDPSLAATHPVLLVKDTQQALYDLAAASRARSTATILAITGSVGKTSSKEMAKLALGGLGSCFASAGNLNNQWGVPLSLARMPQETAYAVFEIGMNHAGEIEPLSRLVKPHAALITRVAATHLAHFDSVDGIADAKAEIFAGLAAGSPAILNRDDERFARLANHAEKSRARIVTFGQAADAFARLVDWRGDAHGSLINAIIDGKPLSYRLGAPGQHQVMNSLAVLAAIAALKLDVATAAKRLAEFGAVAGRGQMEIITMAGGSVTLLDESYNASPASMQAALSVLGLVPATGRRIAVLGDMLELGLDAAVLHQGLRDDVLKAKTDQLFACGPMMRHLFESLPSSVQGAWRDDSAGLVSDLCAAIRPGDVILVKGSLGSRMKLIVDAVRGLNAQPMAKGA